MPSPTQKPSPAGRGGKIDRVAFEAEIALACKAHDEYLAVYGSLGDAVRAMEDEDAALAAEQRMRDRMATTPHAVAARYDRRVSRIMVTLSNGLELAFPPYLAEGLAGAKPDDLAVIELTPTGLGLHWPRLDADLYLPSLLEGVFGSAR